MYWPSPEDCVLDMNVSVSTGRYRPSSHSFLEQLLAVTRLDQDQDQDQDQQLFTTLWGPSFGHLKLCDVRGAPSCGCRQMPAHAVWTNSGRLAGTCHLRHQKMLCRHHQFPR